MKAIHNAGHGHPHRRRVVINRKTTKFESNSQPWDSETTRPLSCYQSQNYKIWKQFTTSFSIYIRGKRLLSIAKLQNLKAIHNLLQDVEASRLVVINRKTTKFESNSQHNSAFLSATRCCYQSQNYKIWKQFTTVFKRIEARRKLLSITKLQNLKAIHNIPFNDNVPRSVVINHKTTKFESNSQHLSWSKVLTSCCYQSQNYKIWKQFTTFFVHLSKEALLLSIAKLQNLKAIHNNCILYSSTSLVVINRKTTKFESNSQPRYRYDIKTTSCYQSQNYKIWKQFTTSIFFLLFNE